MSISKSHILFFVLGFCCAVFFTSIFSLLLEEEPMQMPYSSENEPTVSYESLLLQELEHDVKTIADCATRLGDKGIETMYWQVSTDIKFQKMYDLEWLKDNIRNHFDKYENVFIEGRKRPWRDTKKINYIEAQLHIRLYQNSFYGMDHSDIITVKLAFKRYDKNFHYYTEAFPLPLIDNKEKMGEWFKNIFARGKKYTLVPMHFSCI